MVETGELVEQLRAPAEAGCGRALGRQRQADFWVRGQPGLQSEFQDSQGYTEKPCPEKTKQTNKKKKHPTKPAQRAN
jgi:hypothetical protein